MGRVTVGRLDIKDEVARDVNETVIYVDRQIETIVEKIVEVEKLVHTVSDRPAEIKVMHVEKIEYVQDPELLKQLEKAEYALIQKDLDHKKSSDLLVDETNSSSNALLRSRSKHMIVRQQRSKLVKELREEMKKRSKLINVSYVLMGLVVIELLVLLIK